VSDGLGRQRTVLVLGGGSDVGLATARRLIAGGTKVVILAARRPESLAAAADDLRARGAEDVELRVFDALDLASHASLIDGVFERDRDIDLALLTFGVLPDQAAAEKDASVAIEAARTNYLGAMSVLLPLAERMRAQGHGTIVVLSSVAAERGRRSNFVYGSSKAGLDTFCQGLADQLFGSGVRLLVVRPGFVRSNMTRGLDPAPLAATPDDVARAIVGGLSGSAPVVWVPAKLRWVMSGLRHLPRAVFRRLDI
jgi:decaprenylphospho-beta-D-erythro-pentofuranosid-2-ulose 2-reductase